MTNRHNDIALSQTAYWALALAALGFVAVIVWVSFPELDLKISALFAGGAGDGGLRFHLREHPIAKLFNEVIDEGAVFGAWVLLFGLVFTNVMDKTFLSLARRQWWYLFFAFVTGPALIANALLKENWGRARPRNIEYFGGDKEFTPPFVITDQCATNCSFVSGDASLAWTMLAIALVVPGDRTKWIIASFVFGVIISLTRLVQGAHFASDTVFAGILMSLTAILLYMIIVEKRWGISRLVEQGTRSFGNALKRMGRGFYRRVFAPLTPRLAKRWEASQAKRLERMDHLGFKNRTAQMDQPVFGETLNWEKRFWTFLTLSREEVSALKTARANETKTPVASAEKASTDTEK